MIPLFIYLFLPRPGLTHVILHFLMVLQNVIYHIWLFHIQYQLLHWIWWDPLNSWIVLILTYIFEMDIPCDTTISFKNKLLGFHGFVVYRSHVHIKVPPEARKLLLATHLFVRFHHRSWTGIWFGTDFQLWSLSWNSPQRFVSLPSLEPDILCASGECVNHQVNVFVKMATII